MISRLNLHKVNLSDEDYSEKVDFFKGFNHSLIEITDSYLSVHKETSTTFFELSPYERDEISITYLSQFDDGSPFRVGQPTGAAKEIFLLKNNCKDALSIGSMNPDGYSLSFLLTEKDDIRHLAIEEVGVNYQLQKLADGVIRCMHIQLHNDFYNISKRLISALNRNKTDIRELTNGSIIASTLKDNISSYDEIEQKFIRSM